MTKVLITGGSGFIGSHVADNLLARGDEVLVVDNFATGRRDNLKPRPKLEIVEGDIADRALLDGVFDRFKPQVVVHAAASYKDPDNWNEDVRTNSLGTAHVARASVRLGVRRVVYFQTALCYGTRPIEQPITLAHPIRPDSSYAISKTAGEQYLMLSGLNCVSLRLANAYGPRNLSGPLPTFFHRLTTGKKCFVMDTRRDFIFVSDLVKLVVKAIDGQGPSGAYHASSGSDHSIKELFDSTLAALKITLDQPVEVRERNPDDAYTILLDPSKVQQEFGWRPTTTLSEGIHRAVEYYKEYGLEETYTHLKQLSD